MKKAIFYLLFVLLVIPVITEAKVWRVNNNVGVVADFNYLDGAMAAYAAGDTIHLEPSATSYEISPTTFTTRHADMVTIIGNGYFHFTDDGYQQNIQPSMIHSAAGTIYLNANIKFTGISFANEVVLIQLTGPLFVYGVSFESCSFNENVSYFNNGGYSDQIDQVHFSRNYFWKGFQITISSSYQFNYLNDFTFENNIITQLFKVDIGVALHNPMLVRNNVFLGEYIGFNCYWANNIFKSDVIGPTAFTGSILKNNIFAIPAFTTGATVEANNLYGVSMASMFVSNSPFYDRDFKLNAGSIAIGAGFPNGATPVDCGAYGGPNPYKPFSMPAIPSIYQLIVPASVTVGTDMHITVKSRSNN